MCDWVCALPCPVLSCYCSPRRWRMVGELCTATGAGLEIATAIFPQVRQPPLIMTWQQIGEPVNSLLQVSGCNSSLGTHGCALGRVNGL
jgi:hypothetical protein